MSRSSAKALMPSACNALITASRWMILSALIRTLSAELMTAYFFFFVFRRWNFGGFLAGFFLEAAWRAGVFFFAAGFLAGFFAGFFFLVEAGARVDFAGAFFASATDGPTNAKDKHRMRIRK